MKKIFILFLTLIFISTISTYSQNQTVFNANENLNISLDFYNTNNQAVIKKLAQSNNTNAQQFKYNVSLNINKKVNKITDLQFQLIVNAEKLNFPSFTYYGFTVPSNYTPDIIKYKKTFLKNNVLTKEYNYDYKTLINGQLSLETYNFPPEQTPATQNPTYSLTVTNIKIEFSTQQKDKFIQWTSYVDNYENSITQTNNKISEIQTIPSNAATLSTLPDLNKVYEYNKIAQNNIDFINNTRKEPFFTNLQINQNDPKKLNSILNDLFQKSTTLKNNTNDIIMQLDMLYYQRGVVLFQKNDLNGAKSNFNKSIEANSKYTASHYMLAKIEFQNNNYQGTEDILKNIYNNIKGDAQVMNDVDVLSKNLFDKYLTLADKELGTKNFDAALTWLVKAQNWCKSITSVNCTDDLTAKLQTAHSGKLNIILEQIDKKIAANKIKEAELDLTNAINYRTANVTYLPNDQPIKDRSNNIYNAYITLGDKFKAEGKFEDAITNYQAAKDFCSGRRLVSCTDDLDTKMTLARQGNYESMITSAQNLFNSGDISKADITIIGAENYRNQFNLQISAKYDALLLKIKQKLYDDAISEGKKLCNSTDYTNGLNKYTYAQQIESQYNIKKDTKLPTYITDAAQKLVLQKINDAENKVKANDLNSARTITQEARNISTQFEVENNKQVIDAFANIDKKIFDQQCINYKNEFDNYINLANTNITDKKYIDADKNLQNAITLAKLHPECRIDFGNTELKKQEISDAVIYQNKIISAEKFYKSNSYLQAAEEQADAIFFHISNNIDTRFNLFYIDLITFFTERSNEFILFGTTYYIEKNELDNSLLLMNKLKSNGYKNKFTKNQQTTLGSKLAERDFRNQRESNPKTNITKYTADDKWFKYLKKSYLKTWKKF